ncbi:MAG TPA: PilZ domain-containing protein [Dyella sp.]|nr:PilZ domain-containing protein [Dyella sp.]
MTNSPISSEQRRAQRKRVNFTAVVTDVISGKPMGFLGNLSLGGMLLICQQAPREEAIYQLQMPLHGLGPQPQQIEVGVQAQWHEQAASPGQIWAGFRIIAISKDDAAVIDRWLSLPT